MLDRLIICGFSGACLIVELILMVLLLSDTDAEMPSRADVILATATSCSHKLNSGRGNWSPTWRLLVGFGWNQLFGVDSTWGAHEDELRMR